VSVNFPRREMRVAPLTDYPERFDELDRLRLVRKDGSLVELEIDSVRMAGPKVCVAMAESEPQDVLETVRGAAVVTEADQRYELPKGEYYHDELIGLEVRDPAGSAFGRLTAVYCPGDHHDIYEITGDDGREFLVAAVEHAVLDVDTEAGHITVDPYTMVPQAGHAN